MEETKLFIPQGLKPEREYYEGFGKRELMRAIYGSIGVLLLVAVAYMLTGRMLYVVVVLLFGETGILAMVTRSPMTNLSALDQILFTVQFWKEQQHYRYRQLRE